MSPTPSLSYHASVSIATPTPTAASASASSSSSVTLFNFNNNNYCINNKPFLSLLLVATAKPRSLRLAHANSNSHAGSTLLAAKEENESGEYYYYGGESEKVEDVWDESSLEDERVPMGELIEYYKKAIIEYYKEANTGGDSSGTIAKVEKALYKLELKKNELAEKKSSLSQEIDNGRKEYKRLFDHHEKFKNKWYTEWESEIFEKLIVMVDYFEKARQMVKPVTDGEKEIYAKYQEVYKQFAKDMKSLGLSVVPAVGKQFDSSVHKVYKREESELFKEGTVIQEVRRGLSFRNKLLRPALVKVSSGPGGKNDAATTHRYSEQAAANESNEDIKEYSEEDGGAIESVKSLTKLYKEAVLADNYHTIGEIETAFYKLESASNELSEEVSALSMTLTSDRKNYNRLLADVDDFTKTWKSEWHFVRRDVQGEVILGVLPVYEKFEKLLLQTEPRTEGEEQIHLLYHEVYDKFIDVMLSLRVGRTPPVGNYHVRKFHKVVGREESHEFPEDIIVEEVQRGYHFKNKVIRQALVKVSTGPGPQNSTEAAEIPAL